MKIFFSHNSNDKKNYVDLVANEFSENDIFYDKISFIEGEKNMDEIERGLDESFVFVVFISNNSLESPWVQGEMALAEKRLNNNIKAAIPIIIDDSIKHNDPRIPKWLEPYNIQVIRRPIKAARRIKEKRRETSWQYYPTNRKRENLFIGRNNLIDQFETRFHSDENKPVVSFFSGIPKIGRRSLVRHAFKKNNITTDYYVFPTIELNAQESIEDFILKVSDLGLTDLPDFTDLFELTIPEKIDIAISILNQIKNEKEMIMVMDDGCIVRADRTIVYWFEDLMSKITLYNRLFLCVISSKTPSNDYLYGDDSIYSIFVPELNSAEKSNLFSALCDLEEIEIDQADKKQFLEVFHGHPEQIYYACNCLKNDGVKTTLNRINQIYNYKIESIHKAIDELNAENNQKYKITVLLSLFDFIDYDFFYKIIGEDVKNYILIEELLGCGLCEQIGQNSDYIKLNSAVKEEVLRRGYKVDSSFESKLRAHVSKVLEELNDGEEVQVSEYYYSIKSSMLSGKINELDSRYLIPSHYLKSMKELYDIKRNWKEVIVLADKVLERRKYMDEGIVKEIEYFLCLSLARQRDRRFEDEIRLSIIKESEKYFLKGFYNRMLGHYDYALEDIQKALKMRENFSRARRELVNIYLGLDDYKNALKHAKENYERDNQGNAYHIQAYFMCLIHNITDSNVEIIKRLLSDLSKNQTDAGVQMYCHCESQYLSYVKGLDDEAIDKLKAAIENPKFERGNHYLLIDKFYIALRSDNLDEMNDSISRLRRKIDGDRRTQHYVALQKMEAVLYAYTGDIASAENCVERLRYYPENKKIEFNNRLNEIYQNHIH